MAPALGLVFFNLGAPLALVNAAAGVGLVGSLLSTVAPLALSIGASYLLADRPRAPKPSDGQVEVRQAIPARFFHYGRLKVSGPLFFYEARNGALCKGVLLSSRQIDGVEHVYIDNRVVAVRSDGAVMSAPFVNGNSSFCHFSVALGTANQPANAYLRSIFPEWTSNHRLAGNAYCVAGFSTPDAAKFQEVYPNGEPSVAVQLRGSLLYDPRDGATRWSENAGLAILDYLTHEDGYDIALSRLDLNSFRAFADLCDERVPLAAGGSEARYRVAMSVSLGQARTEVLARLRAACDAQLYTTRKGLIAIRGGRYEQPTVTIDTDAGQVLEFNFEPPDAMSRYNELAIQYLEPALGYVEAEGTPWTDDADFARTGVLKTQQLDLTHVPSHSQARRLAKILMARENCDKMAEALVDIDGLNCFGERIIRFKNPEIDIDQDFWLEGGPEFEAFTVTRLKMRSANAASYQWSPAEEGQSTAIPPDTTPDLNLDPPALTLSETAGPRVVATWTPSPALNRNYEARIRPAGSPEGWSAMEVASTRDRATSAVLAGGQGYVVQIRVSAGPQAVGGWSQDYAIAVTAQNTAARPVDFDSGRDGANVLLTWRNPNVQGIVGNRLYRASGASSSFASATDITGLVYGGPNQAMTVTDAPGTGTWRYWAVSELSDGSRSAPAGPETVTI